MSKTVKKVIWFNSEVEYIGATGVNSVREMAELAIKDGDIADILLEDGGTPTIEDIEDRLTWFGVRADRVPVSVVTKERWEDNGIISCALDAKPGRGYVKVLGVSL